MLTCRQVSRGTKQTEHRISPPPTSTGLGRNTHSPVRTGCSTEVFLLSMIIETQTSMTLIPYFAELVPHKQIQTSLPAIAILRRTYATIIQIFCKKTRPKVQMDRLRSIGRLPLPCLTSVLNMFRHIYPLSVALPFSSRYFFAAWLIVTSAAPIMMTSFITSLPAALK